MWMTNLWYRKQQTKKDSLSHQLHTSIIKYIFLKPEEAIFNLWLTYVFENLEDMDVLLHWRQFTCNEKRDQQQGMQYQKHTKCFINCLMQKCQGCGFESCSVLHFSSGKFTLRKLFIS